MDEVIVVLLILFGVFARIVSVAKRGVARAVPTSRQGGGSAPPQTMAELLEEMRTQLEHARRKQQVEPRTAQSKPIEPPRRARSIAPPRASRSPAMAVESIRPVREVIDYDLEAAGLVASRTAAAELTAEGRPAGAHKAFDDRIREAGAAAAPRVHPIDRLRTAIIWQEILGPPVALQPPAD